MPFRVETITSRLAEYTFRKEAANGENRVTLLVGPNGSGKTQLLLELLNSVSSRRPGSTHSQFRIMWNGTPTRVIAQTFSPFSRFPSERRRTPTISEYLELSSEPYAAVGLTRAYGGGRVSRDAVGRVLRRLYSNPLDVSYFAACLRNIGFHPNLVLHYSKGVVAENINFYTTPDELAAAIRRFLESKLDRRARAAQDFPILRELSTDKDTERLTALLVDSIATVSRRQRPRTTRLIETQFELELDIDENAGPLSARELYAFLVLARTGFLRMRKCYVRPLDRSNTFTQDSFNTELPGYFDITETSSGQQQLISSLFSIAAELENDALLVIDEPELSLHPAWQSDYLDRLNGILATKEGCEVFIATHSPLIAQRARELKFDIIDLNSGATLTKATTSPEVSVDQTLLENFNVPVRDSVYVARLILSLVMGSERGNIPVQGTADRLHSLQKLYESAPQRDVKTEKLIRDAISLIRSASVKRAGGEKS